MNLTNFAISMIRPNLWNKVLDVTIKEIESLPPFKVKVKKKLFSHVTTSVRSFNEFKFNVLLLSYMLLFS